MRVHVLVSGRVQGVGYRYFVYEQAFMLNVNGWVKNLPDGRVEAELEGNDDVVNKLLEKMREGPSMSKVNTLTTDNHTSGERFRDFQVR